MRRASSLFGLLLPVALAACGGVPQRDIGICGPVDCGPVDCVPVDCVPFARAPSGIDLHGEASDWWWQANGRYGRGRVPEVGSAMVFAPASGMPRGHVAVVSEIMSQREVLVAQECPGELGASSGDDRSVGGRCFALCRLVPGPCVVAPLRYSGRHGVSVLGFIYFGKITSHQRIVQNVPVAVRAPLDD